MNENRVKQALQEIGLNSNEAELYFISLSEGPATALRLSKLSKIKRTTVYSIIESLQAKGLMHAQSKGLKRLFVADNPDKLESVLESRKKILTSVMPSLSSLYFKIEEGEGQIRHYSGLEGVKRVYDSILKELKPKDFYLVISDHEKWVSKDVKYFENFKLERSKLDLSIRLLLQDSVAARRNKAIESKYGEKIKILPKNYELPSNMVILPHKVIVVQTVGPIMAMVIEHKSVVQMNKAMFEMIWQAVGHC